MPAYLVTYIPEKKVKTADIAALLADEYVLTNAVAPPLVKAVEMDSGGKVLGSGLISLLYIMRFLMLLSDVTGTNGFVSGETGKGFCKNSEGPRS